MVDCGPLWALCFYHFRCTMPTVVPAAAPFTSVSACLTTFMELIAPDLAHRHPHPHPHLLALYSLFNQWPSAFHRGLEELLEKMANCAPHSTRLLLRVCPPAVSVMSTHPFHALPCHSFAQRCFSCLRALPALCSSALRFSGSPHGLARNFLHMFTAWIFYGLKCFQLESFALRLAPCRSTRTHINSLD